MNTWSGLSACFFIAVGGLVLVATLFAKLAGASKRADANNAGGRTLHGTQPLGGKAKRIAQLVEQASQHYPHDDTRRALSLFYRAIELAEDAPTSREAREDIDIGDLGFACWAAFVCEGILVEEGKEDYTQLLRLVERKSPITAARIRKILRDHEAQNERTEQIGDLYREILGTARENPSHKKRLFKQIKNLGHLCQSRKEWWRLRDLADALVKTDVDYDLCWSLYNAALHVRMATGGDLSTIYGPMGLLRKKEGAFFDATRLFLLAYSQYKTKTSENQIRICLRKMGVDNPKAARDDLVDTLAKQGRDAALGKLKALRISKQ